MSSPGSSPVHQPTIGSTGRDLRVLDLLKNASQAAEKYLAKHPDSEIDVRQELAEAFAEVDDTENAESNLKRAYTLACAEPGGKSSPKAVEIAAKLAYYADVEFADQAYQDARAKFGDANASTQRSCVGSVAPASASRPSAATTPTVCNALLELRGDW